jgi:hypothetical protein
MRPFALALMLAASAACSPAPPAKAPRPAAPRPKPPPPDLGAPAEGARAAPAPRRGCDEATHMALARELERLEGELDRLAVDAATAPWLTRLRALVETPCLFWPGLPGELQAEGPISVMALRAWWGAGGKQAVQHRLLPADRASKQSVVAPSLRNAYTLETHRHDRLAPLFCPAADRGCGAEASAYVRDVDLLLERAMLREAPPPRGLADVQDECADKARAEPEPGLRRASFDACIEQAVPLRTLVPLGRFRAPRGWLVLRGRRGHYGFCDELRAYHLESGAAYVARRCSELTFGAGGNVDHEATSRKAGLSVEAGAMSRYALRRLGLLLALHDRLDRDVRPEGMIIAAPADLPPPDPNQGAIGGSSGSSWGHSGQTQIAFRLSEGATPGALAEGHFLWPNSADVFEQVAGELVNAAEASFRPGCVPASLPPGLELGGAPGGVSQLDASPRSLAQARDELAGALAKLRDKPPLRCTGREALPP